MTQTRLCAACAIAAIAVCAWVPAVPPPTFRRAAGAPVALGEKRSWRRADEQRSWRRAAVVREALDASRLRADFPALDQRTNGAPLVYFDSGATSQKPLRVLEAHRAFYERDNANARRPSGTWPLNDLPSSVLRSSRGRRSPLRSRRDPVRALGRST